MEELEELTKNIGDLKVSIDTLTNQKMVNVWPQNASATLNLKPFSGESNASWTNVEEFETQFNLIATALKLVQRPTSGNAPAVSNWPRQRNIPGHV